MNNNIVSQTTHDFYGQEISLIEQSGESFVLLDQLCSHMSIEREPQRKNLARQVWARGMTSVMEVMLSGENRAYPRTVINAKILGMWLANITTSRIQDAHARALVERYQIELTQKIHEWLTKSSAGVTVDTPELLMARGLQAAQQMLSANELVIAELSPKADAWDEMLAEGQDLQVEEAAKVLCHVGIPTGRDKLFASMAELEWVYRNGNGRWTAMQSQVNNGHLRMIPTKYKNKKTGKRVSGDKQVYIKIKGLERLRILLGQIDASVVDEAMSSDVPLFVDDPQ